MPARLRRARTGLLLVMVGLLGLTSLGPAVTMAGPPRPPHTAAIAAVEGEDVAADEDVVTDATADAAPPSETATDVATDTNTDTDPEPELQPDAETATAAAQAAVQGPAAVTRSWREPVASGVVVPPAGGAPPGGLTCRAAASAEAPIITELRAGDAVQITGDKVIDGAGSGWYPINCAGVGGFVRSSSVILDEPANDEAEATTASDVTRDQTATAERATHEATTATKTDTKTAPEQVATETATETATMAARTATTSPSTATATLAATDPAPKTATAAAPASATATARQASARVAATAEAALATVDAPVTSASNNVAAGEIGGTVTVTGTGGRLNCRAGATSTARILTTVAEGATLTVRGEPTGDWLPVVCGRFNGYVASRYVSAVSTPVATARTAATLTTFTTAAVSSETATVRGTNGAGVRCRTGAGTSYGIITVLAEGSVVTLRGAASNGWQPVVCSGRDGWVSAQYLSVNATSPTPTPSPSPSPSPSPTPSPTASPRPSPTPSPTPSPSPPLTPSPKPSLTPSPSPSPSPTPATSPTSGGAVTGTAKVINTGGAGVRCRTGAGTTFSIIVVVPEGSTVSVRGSSAGGWTPVVCGGRNGYISSAYLSSTTSGGTPTPTPSPTPSPTVSPTPSPTSTPRPSPTPSPTASPTPSPTPSPSPTPPTVLVSGDHAKTTASLNLREAPSTTATVLTVAPTGTVVKVTGGATNGFYPVDWDGLKGYMGGSYLIKTTEPLSKRGTTGTPPSGELIIGSGPVGSLARIWGYQNFRISQEYGHTQKSMSTTMYAYGTSYGLDGWMHPGLDISMPVGTALSSPIDGVVKVAGGTPYFTHNGTREPGTGQLTIQSSDGHQVILGHMSAISVKVGDQVTAGQFVGLSGGTPHAHLHLEVRELQRGVYRIVDPRQSFLTR